MSRTNRGALSPSMARLCARIRMPLVWAGAGLVIVSALFTVPVLALPGAVLLVAGMALYLRVGTVRADPVTVEPPVAGRWAALNSPTTRVPSHGLHAYGQTYAIDLVHEPPERTRPSFGWRPLVRRPEDFPAFGQPVLAAADGLVVRAHARERDHWSRNSWPVIGYLLVEGMVRELLGVGRLLGNHVVVEHDDGTYAAYAHLRRGSVRVQPGQRVHAGEQLAECGNSGNSSEPHLHFQLMDRRRPAFAAGLPFRFTTAAPGDAAGGVPANGAQLDAPPRDALATAR